jgi:hypothetical protein
LEHSRTLLHALLEGDMQALSAAMHQHGGEQGHHCGMLTSDPQDGSSSGIDQPAAAAGLQESDDQEDAYLQPPQMHRQWQPLEIYVVVPALPRGAAVEVQPLALSLLVQQAEDVHGVHASHPDPIHACFLTLPDASTDKLQSKTAYDCDVQISWSM